MRILINTLNFYPETIGIGKYSGEMARWLVMRGHEVTVITSYPYYPRWRVSDGFKKYFWSREILHGVRVWRCPIWIPTNVTGLTRLIHLATFSLSSFPIMFWKIFWRPNIVMTIEPPFFTSPTALITSKISGAKSILHIQDYEIDAAFNLGILKGVFLKSVILKIEKLLMRQFDLISTISGAMVKKAISKGVQPEKTFFFPNWVDVASSLQPSQGCNIVRASTYIDYRERLQLPMESVVALYSGNMGAKQGLEILGQAAKRFADSDMPLPQLHFVFCGDGVGRNALMDLCSGLKNVRFIDLQPEEQLVNFLTMADIHLLPQRGGAADIVMPSKLGGILASGRPVLACAHIGTELANVSKIGGLVVPPNDLDAFCGALLNLVIDPELRCRLGQAGLQYAVDNLDKDLILGSFEAKLKELAQ